MSSDIWRRITSIQRIGDATTRISVGDLDDLAGERLEITGIGGAALFDGRAFEAQAQPDGLDIDWSAHGLTAPDFTWLGGGMVRAAQKTRPCADARMRITFADNTLFIVYRGTEPGSLYDLWRDVDISRESTPWGDVGAGFLLYAEDVWEAVWSALSEHAGRVEHIVLTGHSLGGAAAVIAACSVYQEFRAHWPKVSLITFGAPRSIRRRYMRQLRHYLPNRCVDVQREGDLIPAVPFYFLKYRRHHGRIYFTRSGTAIYEYGSAKAYLRHKRRAVLLSLLTFWRAVKRHAAADYYEDCKRLET